jgi:hypothetical protein
MRTVVIKNNTSEVKTWLRTFQPGEEYILPTDNTILFKYSVLESLLIDIANGEALIGNGDIFYTSVNDQLNYLKGNLPQEVNISSAPPFSSKIIDNKKIFRRKHGFSFVVPANSNNSLYLTVPYNEVLINEVELTNCVQGDSIDFFVYDSVNGLYQQSLGVPAGSVNSDLMLNQFGFGVYLPQGFYRDRSEYDAKLFGTMRVKITYYNNNSVENTVLGNIIYHELVS